MSEEKKVTEREYPVPEAHVHLIQGPKINHAFVRLVPLDRPGRMAMSLDAEAVVDLDHQGNIMGVTVTWWNDDD